MNVRLRRLAVAFSLTMLIGFGSWAGYSYYHYRNLQSYLESQMEAENEARQACMASDEPMAGMRFVACTRLKGFTEAGSYSVVPARDGYYSDARRGIWLAIGLPCLAFFLLFVGRWMTTGKTRTSK